MLKIPSTVQHSEVCFLEHDLTLYMEVINNIIGSQLLKYHCALQKSLINKHYPTVAPSEGDHHEPLQG